MDIPKHFTDELERMLEEDRKAKEKVAKQRIKASEDEDRKLREGRLETNLGICEKIFDWKDEFLKTDEGFSLLSKHNRILIYEGGLGHLLKTEDCFACCSTVYIAADDVEYRAGYKSYLLREKRFIEPRQMAVALNSDYLAQLLNSIESGKVYDYMLRNNK